MKKDKILKWIIFAIASAINLFILANSFLNGDASTAESTAVINTTAGVINGIVPESVNNDNLVGFATLIRKVFGHFGLFGLSGIMSTWSIYLFLKDSKLNYFVHVGGISSIAGFILAWLSEAIQLFTPGRSGSVADVALDFIGYFIGVLLVILILFLAKKPIFSKDQQNEK